MPPSPTFQSDVLRNHHLWHSCETLSSEIHTFICRFLTFNNRLDTGTMYLNDLSREHFFKNCQIRTQLAKFSALFQLTHQQRLEFPTRVL